MRDASKARGVEHTGVFERRATPLAAMQRRPNALFILQRALSSHDLTALGKRAGRAPRCAGERCTEGAR